jgi:polyisoprenoid-binding protein YceI
MGAFMKKESAKMKRIFPVLCFTFALYLSVYTAAEAAIYEIDSAHSSVGFKIRHLVSKVKGGFSHFGGTIEMDQEDLIHLSTSVIIDAASIDTHNQKRDDHLRSSDFFDVVNYPTVVFNGKGVEGDKMVGELTMHGVTQEVILDLEFHGVANDARGGERAGFSAMTTIDRKDFGITYNKTLDQGGLLLGEQVSIEIEIEARLKE